MRPKGEYSFRQYYRYLFKNSSIACKKFNILRNVKDDSKKTTFANILPPLCICSQHLRLYKFQAEIFYLLLIGIFILSFEIKKTQ